MGSSQPSDPPQRVAFRYILHPSPRTTLGSFGTLKRIGRIQCLWMNLQAWKQRARQVSVQT
jgi:hypothetical protein